MYRLSANENCTTRVRRVGVVNNNVRASEMFRRFYKYRFCKRGGGLFFVRHDRVFVAPRTRVRVNRDTHTSHPPENTRFPYTAGFARIILLTTLIQAPLLPPSLPLPLPDYKPYTIVSSWFNQCTHGIDKKTDQWMSVGGFRSPR